MCTGCFVVGGVALSECVCVLSVGLYVGLVVVVLLP